MADLGIPGVGAGELIASGGSALVYAARTGTGADVAVKVLRGIRGAEVQRRFEREQSAAERLQEHPNIIDIIDSGVTEAGEPYLVMPLLQASLADELEERGASTPSQAVADVKAAAMAIDFAHNRGVLHRDIKPGNVLRRDDGSISVTDFGIARVLDAGITSATLSASTPLYAAPELLEANEASVASDVYALGALLYALLDGHAAFADAANLWATIARIRTEAVPTIDGVHPPLMRVIEQAMSKSPADRPWSAAQFATNLDDAFDAHPDWRPPKPLATTVPTPTRDDVGVPVVEFDAPAAVRAPSDPGDASTAPAAPPASDGPSATLKVVATIAALAVLAGMVWFGISRTLRSDDDSVASPDAPLVTQPTPTPTSTPSSPDDEPTVEPTAEATPVPPDRLASFNGSFFSAYLPPEWELVRQDIDVGYGYRNEFANGEDYLTIDTTPSELRTSTETIAESARRIAATISSSSAVVSEEVDGLELHSFTFVNNRGIESIDIFFEVDGDGYAIVAGSRDTPVATFAAAKQVALTIRSAP